jgi:hypothetical protein
MWRWKKKVIAKEDCYRDGTGEKQGLGGSQMGGKRKKISQQDRKIQTTPVMLIPSTREGLLTRLMQERELEMAKITRFRVRMQEEAGIQLDRLFSTDLARGEPCGREDCCPCKASSGRPNFKQASILYESKCDKGNPDKTGNSSLQEGNHHLEGMEESRKEERREGVYIGESSMSLYEQSKEHLSDAEGFQEWWHTCNRPSNAGATRGHKESLTLFSCFRYLKQHFFGFFRGLKYGRAFLEFSGALNSQNFVILGA